jgi:hypothetical protein
MSEKDLKAPQLAVQMDQKTTAYLLSMVSLEVSLQIKSADRSKPEGIYRSR